MSRPPVSRGSLAGGSNQPLPAAAPAPAPTPAPAAVMNGAGPHPHAHSAAIDAAGSHLHSKLAARPSHEELEARHIIRSSAEDAEMHEQFLATARMLDGKLARRSRPEDLENRNILKSNRLRSKAIDFAEASSHVSLMLRARSSSTEAQLLAQKVQRDRDLYTPSPPVGRETPEPMDPAPVPSATPPAPGESKAPRASVNAGSRISVKQSAPAADLKVEDVGESDEDSDHSGSPVPTPPSQPRKSVLSATASAFVPVNSRFGSIVDGMAASPTSRPAAPSYSAITRAASYSSAVLASTSAASAPVSSSSPALTSAPATATASPASPAHSPSLARPSTLNLVKQSFASIPSGGSPRAHRRFMSVSGTDSSALLLAAGARVSSPRGSMDPMSLLPSRSHAPLPAEAPSSPAPAPAAPIGASASADSLPSDLPSQPVPAIPVRRGPRPSINASSAAAVRAQIQQAQATVTAAPSAPAPAQAPLPQGVPAASGSAQNRLGVRRQTITVASGLLDSAGKPLLRAPLSQKEREQHSRRLKHAGPGAHLTRIGEFDANPDPEAEARSPTSGSVGGAPEEEKEAETEDDELKFLNNTLLILERIQLEKGLAPHIRRHIDSALDYLTEAQRICEARTTHIEKAISKRLSTSGAAEEDQEVVQWLSQEYTEAPNKRRSVMDPSPPTDSGGSMPPLLRSQSHKTLSTSASASRESITLMPILPPTNDSEDPAELPPARSDPDDPLAVGASPSPAVPFSPDTPGQSSASPVQGTVGGVVALPPSAHGRAQSQSPVPVSNSAGPAVPLLKTFNRKANAAGGTLSTSFANSLRRAVTETTGAAAAALQGAAARPRSAKPLTTHDRMLQLRGIAERKDVTEVLQTCYEWNFDVFRLEEVTEGRPLAVLATHLLQCSGLAERLALVPSQIFNFFTAVEGGYHKTNPFHQNIHGTDVMQCVFFFLQAEAVRRVLSPQDMLAAIVAASVHDLGHPGTTNGFLVETGAPLALRYNDISVLENYHLACAFRILQNPECDILSGFPRAERQSIRESIINMVLATDMRQHVHHMAEFEGMLRNKKAKGQWLDGSNKEDKKQLLNMCLHTADLNNPCKPRYLYTLWVDRLYAEFYAQGDKERSLGLPISPMMDRTKPNVERAQVGFIDYVIRPLYAQWAEVVPLANICLKHLNANYEYYASKVARLAAAAASTTEPAAPAPAPQPAQPAPAPSAEPSTSAASPSAQSSPPPLLTAPSTLDPLVRSLSTTSSASSLPSPSGSAAPAGASPPPRGSLQRKPSYASIAAGLAARPVPPPLTQPDSASPPPGPSPLPSIHEHRAAAATPLSGGGSGSASASSSQLPQLQGPPARATSAPEHHQAFSKAKFRRKAKLNATMK